MSTLAERLEEALNDKGAKPAELARACGITAPSVSDWLSGKTKKIEGGNLLLAAEFLGVSPWWLATGKEHLELAKFRGQVLTFDDKKETESATDTPSLESEDVDWGAFLEKEEPKNNSGPGADRSFYSGPLLSWEKARDIRKLLEIHSGFADEQWLPIPTNGNPNCFWLRVEGESMYDPGNEPSFNHGDLIVVDMTKTPENRDCVILRMHGSETGVAFKQLYSDPDGTRLLKSLNPKWPSQLIPFTKDAYVIGVVVGKWESK